MSIKTIVISIDCLNAALFEEASRSEEFPALSGLRRQGGAVRLKALGLSAESDWHSFYTGYEPGIHGHVGYDEILPGTYRSRLTSGSRSKQETFLQSIAKSGSRVFAINPTHLRVQREKNLEMITCFQSHDAGHYFPLESYPGALARELRRRFPDDPVNPNDWGHSKGADPQNLLSAKRETLKQKLTVFAEMSGRNNWDLAFLGLDECHEMSHLFWHLHDQTHFAHERNKKGAFDPIKLMLKDIDKGLEKLVEEMPAGTVLVVLSTSGIAANYHWSHLVDELLDAFESGGDSSRSSYASLRKLWNQFPHSFQRRLYKLRHQLRETMLQGKRSRRIAFAMPINEVSGAVRLNLIGREPNGLVAEENYEQVCGDLKAKFESLVCAETGINLVSKVKLSRHCQQGPYVDALPDLIIEWNTRQKISRVVSPFTGAIERNFDDARTGHHINAGFLLTNCAEGVGPATTPVAPITRIARALAARHQGSSCSFHKLLQTDPQ